MKRDIRTISNFYGCLQIKIEYGLCYWGLGDWSGQMNWERIPDGLFVALNEYADEIEGDLE